MADNEEIIFIFRRINSIKDGIRTEKYKDIAITRQAAIEIMAKALCRLDNLLERCEHCITQCDKEKQKNMCEHILKKRDDNIEPSYFDKAEAALNALLGVEK